MINKTLNNKRKENLYYLKKANADIPLDSSHSSIKRLLSKKQFFS